MKKITHYFMFALLLMMVSSAFAQQRTITGKVTSLNEGEGLPGVNIVVKGTTTGTTTDMEGNYKITVPDEGKVLVFAFVGYTTQEITIGSRTVIDVQLKEQEQSLNEIVVLSGVQVQRNNGIKLRGASGINSGKEKRNRDDGDEDKGHNTESYQAIDDNKFHKAIDNPLSTFSVDVDAASYTNVRRFLNEGSLPPVDAVRVEEFINYFDYNYTSPSGKVPFSVSTEVTTCPWNEKHQLVQIGLQGKKIPFEQLAPNNLVFLIDVSGSMSTENKLPLLQKSLALLVKQLRPADRVAIVVYAGSAGLVLPSTSGQDKETILAALNRLSAGGSTAGGAGIHLAYKVAKENFLKEGNNRVILATDGDFNVGVSSDAEMRRLIEEKREDGIAITVLGFGMGNYQDSKMEEIADHGNGNYFYIDTEEEAKKVLVTQMDGTLHTIAKDVKIQVEFNPAHVKSYRLVGYENRKLDKEDFKDDKKDAGDIGAGHTVTALYEVELHKGKGEKSELKYTRTSLSPEAAKNNELMTVKLRYKEPDASKSQEISTVVEKKDSSFEQASENLRFAAAVASFAMLLRNSEHKGEASYEKVIAIAQAAKGEDKEGYRAEFIELVNKARGLKAN